MSAIKSSVNRNRHALHSYNRIKMRAQIRQDFSMVPDHRADNTTIPLADALMSGFAMFSLKDPSLLAFDIRRREDHASLHTVYGVEHIPCDTFSSCHVK